MKVLELFAGTGSFSNIFKERGHEVFTVELDPRFNPRWCVDIMKVQAKDILERFGQPDVIWASPPCQCFSVASCYRHWKDGKPISPGAKKSIELVKHTLSLISDLKPKYWFIENPRGMLRKQEFMPNKNRRTVTYCQYKHTYGEVDSSQPSGRLYTMKPTDIWTNCVVWLSRTPCGNGDSCHTSAPRGSRTGIQGMEGSKKKGLTTAQVRSVVPRELCEEICDSIEKENRIQEGQETFPDPVGGSRCSDGVNSSL